MDVVKSWTKCVNDLLELYTPGVMLPPEKDKWRLAKTHYIYKSNAPVSSIEVLNGWVESTEEPKIHDSFFIRENLDRGQGVYEAVPMSLLKAPVLVKRYVVRTYYSLGGNIDPCYDPKNEFQYHVKYVECKPEEDKDYIWNAAGRGCLKGKDDS